MSPSSWLPILLAMSTTLIAFIVPAAAVSGAGLALIRLGRVKAGSFVLLLGSGSQWVLFEAPITIRPEGPAIPGLLS